MANDLQRFDQATSCLPSAILSRLGALSDSVQLAAQEIRLRLNRPIEIVCPESRYYIKQNGCTTQILSDGLPAVTRRELDETFHALCGYSVYSHGSEIAEGFLPLKGGHRAGLCGTAVFRDGRIVNLRDISSVCIRIAREHRGCAEELFYRLPDGGALICGEPCSGKTTLLRDLGRLCSTVGGKTTALIDERGELAGTVGGEHQNDVGMCDVLDGFPKAQGMLTAIRSLSPQLIICDELGSREDAEAVLDCLNRGVDVIAAVHAESCSDILSCPAVRAMIEAGAFKSLVFLSDRRRAGKIRELVPLGDLHAA